MGTNQIKTFKSLKSPRPRYSFSFTYGCTYIVRQPMSYTLFWGIKFFFMDSVSLGIADNQTENWNFVSVEQFKI